MENVIYMSEVTEYESGWGQRPDGYFLAISVEKYEEGVKKVNAGPQACYSRAGDRKLVKVTSEMFEKVKASGSIWISESKSKWYIEG